MKKLLLKKLSAFILMIFFFSFSHAQQCKGPNHILVCQCARYSDFYCYPVCKCIHVSQLKSYLNDGWKLSSSSDAAKINNSSSDLFSFLVINSTSINVVMAESQNVSLKIYDVTGKLIKTLADSRMREGDYQIDWNKKDEKGNAVSNGIYILQFNAGSYSDTKRLSII